MRRIAAMLELLLTASAAWAGNGPGNYSEEWVAGASLSCLLPLLLLGSAVAWLVHLRRKRIKRTDPRWSLSELPPFPPSGPG